VRDGFDRADANEGRHIKVDLPHLLAAAFETGAHQGVNLAVEGLDVGELSRPRYLLGEDSVQLRIDAVGFDRDGAASVASPAA